MKKKKIRQHLAKANEHLEDALDQVRTVKDADIDIKEKAYLHHCLLSTYDLQRNIQNTINILKTD